MRNRQPGSSPPSPMSPTLRKSAIPPGFRPSPRPKQRPVAEMTIRELQDLHKLNMRLLSSPGASTSTFMQRVLTEQAAIESRLIELDGVETINTGLKKTRIIGEGDMKLDMPQESPTSRTLEAKRKALSRYTPANQMEHPGSLSLQEAMDIERQAHLQDMERQKRILEKKKRLGMPIKGEVLSRQEREARIWAFMNHKPSESDLEDANDDEDEDDDDPSTWFEDDQDDGRKGQDIVEPDIDDLTNIIRIDESRIHYSTFYEPRDEGD